MQTITTSFNHDTLYQAAALWGFRLNKICPEIEIAGSPERCEFRAVIESDKHERFILEQIFPETLERKRRIARIIDELYAAGLRQIIPYLKTDAAHVVTHDGNFWQMQPYLSSEPLNRPDYAFEQWRGEGMADFVITLRQCAQNLTEENDPVFSLKEYVRRLMKDIEGHDPQHLDRIRPVHDFLERLFFPVYDELATGFCHGDFHAINILWGPRKISTVIDWEFLGLKNEMYDVANMVGCLGIEHPDALVSDCVLAFLKKLRAPKIFTPQSWNYLLETILANRFGWMAEWLRKRDWEMVEMECDYWDILIDRRDVLKSAWGIDNLR